MKRAGRVGVLGIPFDANSSFRRGPARAPAAIRRALDSESGNTYSERGVRVWPSEFVVDHGDLRVPQRAGVRAPLDVIQRGVTRALATTPRLLLLGGDHAITYPVVRAMAQRWGRLSLLQFDAHPDMYPEYEGNRYSHASPMARILEEGLVERLVQVGIRSVSPAQTALARKHGVEVHPAYDLAKLPRLRFSTSRSGVCTGRVASRTRWAQRPAGAGHDRSRAGAETRGRRCGRAEPAARSDRYHGRRRGETGAGAAGAPAVRQVRKAMTKTVSDYDVIAGPGRTASTNASIDS
jgi:hypothetical protein